MPGEGGIEATRQITARFPQIKVVMLTSFADDELVVRAIRAGAVGYVLKQVDNAELLRAIEAAARGEALLDSATTARLLARVRESERKADEDAFRELSDREMDVLASCGAGQDQRRNRTLAQSEREDGQQLRQHDPGKIAFDESHRIGHLRGGTSSLRTSGSRLKTY